MSKLFLTSTVQIRPNRKFKRPSPYEGKNTKGIKSANYQKRSKKIVFYNTHNLHLSKICSLSEHLVVLHDGVYLVLLFFLFLPSFILVKYGLFFN